MSVAPHRTPPHRLRIGVSGHRVPPKLPEAAEAPLRASIDRALAAAVGAARDVDDDRSLRLVILSSLAEGSDRIVAEAGLAAGFSLEVVLPLSRAEYVSDFETPASRAEFERLLARASDIIELDGAASDRPRAYEAAGLFMLANIDVLIAIWDGASAAGIGGTAQIVDRAIADGVLVLWIEPVHPNVMRLSVPTAAASGSAPAVENGFRVADLESIAKAIGQILTSPQ